MGHVHLEGERRVLDLAGCLVSPVGTLHVPPTEPPASTVRVHTVFTGLPATSPVIVHVPANGLAARAGGGGSRRFRPFSKSGSIAARSARYVTVSAVGKVAGTLCVTPFVAAHSVPRWNVAVKPTELSPLTSCPSAVWKMRPLP